MSSWPHIALQTAVALSLVSSAHALDSGDIGIFFDEAATQTAITVGALEPFHFYVIANAVPDGILAYAFLVELDPRIEVLTTVVFPLGSTDVGVGDDNWIVDTQGVCLTDQGLVTLVEYEARLLEADLTDMTICLRAAQPQCFDADVCDLPSYRTCLALDDIRVFNAAYDGCAVINPENIEPPIRTHRHTWGALKAVFE